MYYKKDYITKIDMIYIKKIWKEKEKIISIIIYKPIIYKRENI